MYDAAQALKDAMIDLEIAIDGGKDSLSMAAKVIFQIITAVLCVSIPSPLYVLREARRFDGLMGKGSSAKLSKKISPFPWSRI